MANVLISWQENFSLGLEAIDEQHKSLVDIINRVWQSIVEKSEKSVVFSLIEDLERYTHTLIPSPTLPLRKPLCA